ncbi:MAG: hypothetical protein IH621_18455 [Krumholzibacteria bacterium]|nr:hypothetical protein [Candidatus Krumholzibacteria bacterium]
MTRDTYDYRFEPETDMTHVEEVLLLATMAAEGLHGRSRVHLDAAFRCEPAAFSAEVEAGTETGDAIARIFTALLATTIGEAAFSVTRSRKGRCA